MTSVHSEEMAFKGQLIQSPNCTIDDGQVIDIAFGNNIGIRKLDGVNYRQTINYEISCGESDFDWSMSLKISGQTTLFNPAALQTSVDGLGIEILQNGEPFILGKPLTIDPKRKPILQAVPVKDPNADLIATDFNVTATLTAEYQ
jgi:type 1 fimbria pilin